MTDAVVIGAGLAGLVATCELLGAGRRVTVVEQESPVNLGGQAHWSFGGLFLVDSPEQRRMRIHDSLDLAWQDWVGTAGFDRPEDHWPQRWARAYVEFAAGEKRSWLAERGVKLFPVVGWAERGGYAADGPGNSVPRFHIVWGTGPGLLEPFVRQVREAMTRGQVELRFRHRVDGLIKADGVVTGVHGSVLAEDDRPRGVSTSREVTGEFSIETGAVIVTSGGIGGDPELVRRNWPERLGPAPRSLLRGVPAHVDGRMLDITRSAGGRIVNADRMWHYTEGIAHHDPVWPAHGIRILPGPSSLWLDATGRRLPVPLFPGFDTLGTLAHIGRTGHEHTWFVLTRSIIEREFTLSGSDQNPDLTGKDLRGTLSRAGSRIPAPIEAFLQHGADFVTSDSVEGLVSAMNQLTDQPLLDPVDVRRLIEARDRELANPYGKDLQLTAVRSTRRFIGDRLIRTAAPHRLLDPEHGPLIAVRLHLLTRKTLGGLETDLSGRVLDDAGTPVPGLFAAGEVAGFGGGGMHGYRSLEGTFLGGCLFSGRIAGRAAARSI